jgi:ankyrin repeat protein
MPAGQALPRNDEMADFENSAKNGNASAVFSFLDKYDHLAPEQIDRLHATALIGAACANKHEFIEQMLERYPDIDLRKTGNGNMTAFMYAVLNGHTKLTEIFLKAGADPNQQSHDGWTAFLYAAGAKNRTAELELMISHGADLDARLDDGSTALMLAEKACAEDAAEVLGRHLAERDKSRAKAEAEKQRQWLEDTDFSGGLDKPLRTRKPLAFDK